MLLASAPGASAEFPLVRTVERTGAEAVASGSDGTVWLLSRPAQINGDERFALDRISRYGRSKLVVLPRQRRTTTPRAAAMAVGTDGNLWLAIDGMRREGETRVVRVTPGGVTRLFRLPPKEGPVESMAAGPDGDIWYLGAGRDSIGRISRNGRTSSIAVRGASRLRQIVQGHDGFMWAVGRGVVVRISRSHRVKRIKTASQYSEGPIVIARGPGEAMWISGPGMLQRIAVSGKLSSVLLLYPWISEPAGPGEVYPGNRRFPVSIAPRADGLLGFSAAAIYESRDESETYIQSFGSVDAAGMLNELKPPSLPILLMRDESFGDPLNDGDRYGRGRMIAGPDGRMWVVSDGNAVEGVAVFDLDREFVPEPAAPGIAAVKRSAGGVRVELSCTGAAGRFCNGRVALRQAGKQMAQSRRFTVATGDRLRLVLHGGRMSKRGRPIVECTSFDSVSGERKVARRPVAT